MAARTPALNWPSQALSIRALARRAFSFPVLLGGVLVAAACRGSVFFFFTKAEGDTWWHVAVGEYILTHRTWPETDFYSFTAAGVHWMAYEWLPEVVLALVMRTGDLGALQFSLMLLASALTLLIYYYAHLRSRNAKAAFWATLLLLPLAALFFTIRPQLVGNIFLVLTLICLELFRQGRHRALWLLPPIFLLWANTHGSFAVGTFILGVYWLSGLCAFRLGGLVAERWTPEQRRQLAVVLLLSILALFVTPYGTSLATYPVELALFQPINIAHIGEWHPPRFHSIIWQLFLVLLLGFFLAQVVLRLSYRTEEIVLLLWAAFMTCVHRRFAIVFVVVFAPLLATLLSRWVSDYQPARDRHTLNAALILSLLTGLALFFPSTAQLERAVERAYPHGAVRYLRQNPVPSPMFNDSDWGGYLIWTLDAKHKVFIDGRLDIYEYAGVLRDYMHTRDLEPDTLSILRKYGIRSCLLARNAPLSTLLAALPDWQLVYQDEVAAIYLLQNGTHAEGARQSGPTSQAENERHGMERAPGEDVCKQLRFGQPVVTFALTKPKASTLSH